jgi:flagellar hook-associated protein 1 FlgK
MSLSLALNTSLSGLGINQKALEVVSQNIANVNTAGYSRKILSQQAEYLAGNGVGVSLSDVSRKVDAYLQGSIRTQASAVGRTSYVSDYLDRTQLLFGNPGASNSVNSYITNFFNILQSLSQTPEDSSLKTSAVQNATTLASQMSSLANSLQEQRSSADNDLADYVKKLNGDIKQIDILNTTIAQNKALGRSVSELEDRRDQFLNDVAQYMDIQTFTRSNGAINISVGGVSLLDDNIYQIKYVPVSSPSALSNNVQLSALQVYRTDLEGNPTGTPAILATQATSSQVATVIGSGKIKGIFDIRDRQIPNMLAQLDMLAANLRDQFNAIHNSGSGYPGANSYTGTHLLSPQDPHQWSGGVRIAVLDSQGKPIPTGYDNEPNGLPPLNLDLSTLNGGFGAGIPTTQSIINEINQYFGIPQNKVQLGNLSNIQLASNSSSLPGSPPRFSFDLDLQNLSSRSSNVFVTNVQVLDDTNADITSVTQNVPSLAIDPTNGFVTQNGSGTITINTTAAHGLSAGDSIYLNDITAAVAPALTVNGIALAQLNDKLFTISNVTANSFDITVASGTATSSGAVASTGATLLPPYTHSEPGEKARTTADGTIDVGLSGNSSSSFYTINLDVQVVDANGTVSTSTIAYRVDNNQRGLLNHRFPPRTASSDGIIIPPATTQAAARAMMVDANGNELSIVNGQYSASEVGYLKIVAGNSSYSIDIDPLDSTELGYNTTNSSVAATNRNFSHFYGLNNFFVDPDSDSVDNSALNFAVESRIQNNADLFSTGNMSAIIPPAGSTSPYTYERTVGNQSIVSRLSDLALTNVAFSPAGGLGTVTQTLAGYAGQMVSSAAAAATAAKQDDSNAQLLSDGFTARSNAVTGVNLDDEVAHTVILQNAYTASARVVSVVKDLFDILFQAF